MVLFFLFFVFKTQLMFFFSKKKADVLLFCFLLYDTAHFFVFTLHQHIYMNIATRPM